MKCLQFWQDGINIVMFDRDSDSIGHYETIGQAAGPAGFYEEVANHIEKIGPDLVLAITESEVCDRPTISVWCRSTT